MITKLIALAFMLPVLISFSCGGGGPELTVEKMRALACGGDVEGFFSYIDKDAVKESVKQNTIDKFTQSASEGTLAERSQGMSKRYEESMVPAYMKTLWGNLDSWVELGESGPLCKMEITKIKGDSITISLPGQPGVIWVFKKSDGGWKLVSIL